MQTSPGTKACVFGIGGGRSRTPSTHSYFDTHEELLPPMAMSHSGPNQVVSLVIITAIKGSVHKFPIPVTKAGTDV